MKWFWKNDKKDVRKTINSSVGINLIAMNSDYGDTYMEMMEPLVKCKIRDYPDAMAIMLKEVVKDAPEEILEMTYSDFVEKFINGEIEDW